MGGKLSRTVIMLFYLQLISCQFVWAQDENKIGVDTLNTVLFKVTSSHSNKVSYLFGTHHAFGKYFFDTLYNVHQALSASEVLIKENLNISGHLAEDIINRRTVKTKWSKYLKIDELAFVKNLFASSPTNFYKMTPTEMYVFLNRHFNQQVCLSKGQTDPPLTLDDYIALKAKEHNAKLFGLETTEEQIELINKDVEGMPRKVHKRRLSNIIAKIKSRNNNYCEETEWYKQMEIDYQFNLPCSNNLLLTDRNNKWMSDIIKLIETKNCFIAVGLSHLMYECGLIKQLQNQSYTISPVKVNQ